MFAPHVESDVQSVSPDRHSLDSRAGLGSFLEQRETMSDVAALRLRAFSAKLALKRLSGFHQQVTAAKLLDALPDVHEIAAAPDLQQTLSEFADVHRRVEALLVDQVACLMVEAQGAANRYALARYGFAPGDLVKFEPAGGVPMRLRVTKIFLQTSMESDIRVEAASVRSDGSPADSWDLYYAGPGQLQVAKSRRRAESTS
jgi:hypothetical protein